MKSAFLFPLRSPSRNPSRRGVALVSVLAIVVLITALVVAFLVRAGSEKIATSHYDATSNTRVLSDTVVNLVQATISEATTVQAASGQRNAWASQPGAIRVFDNANLKKIYRLYSAPTLATDTTDGSILADDLPPNNWASLPSEWVDLNAPAVVSGMGGTNDQFLVYPILDPRNPADPGTVTSPKVTTAMPGFSISSAVPPAPANQPAPMPVRWLYVLQNGQIVPPQVNPSGEAIIAGASASNPITGRIAFWTDDETSKVNINTAAGSFSDWDGKIVPGTWDVPRFKFWEDRMLFSENQPVKGEYQRYPGHPATTDLYRILKALNVSMGDYPYKVQSISASPQPAPISDVSTMFNLLPRYTDSNSSRAGSKNTTSIANPPVINNGVAVMKHLYTSVGELLYNPARNSNGLNRQQVESGKFFLTAQSRAPETTLFGTPRIAMWPIHSQNTATTRTSLDKLLAFCSTANGYPYYFQREDSRDPKNDYTNIARNRQLFSYLKTLVSQDIPGFGGSFRGKYSFESGTNNEMNQILAEMWDYIRCTNLFDRSDWARTTASYKRFTGDLPKVAGYTFQGLVTPLKIEEGGKTYGGLGRAQTISEIGIQIICTAEASDTDYQNPVDVGGKTVSPVVGSANDPRYVSNLPEEQYLRDASNNIVGLDRTNSLSDTYRTPMTGTPTVPAPGSLPFFANPTLSTTYGGTLTALSKGQKRLQAMLLFEIASPMMGYHGMNMNDPSNLPAFKLNVSGIQGIDINGSHPFPTSANGMLDKFPTRSSEQGTGGILGFRYPMRGRVNGWSNQQAPLLTIGAKDATTGEIIWTPQTAYGVPYPYVSNPFTVASTSSLSLGGEFTVQMMVPTSGGQNTYQEIEVHFPNPSGGAPLPDLVRTGLTKPSTVYEKAPDVAADWWGFDFRIRQAGGGRIHTANTKTPVARIGAVIRADAASSLWRLPESSTTQAQWSYRVIANNELPTFANQNTPAKFAGSDVVRTLVAKDGDFRLIAAQSKIRADGSSSSPFAKGPGYDDGVKLGHLFKDQSGAFTTSGVDQGGSLVNSALYSPQIVPKIPTGMASQKQSTWDWDNGLVSELDGPYANKPDEGNIYVNNQSPYYNREQQGDMTDIASYFTTNRIMNSPVMFGSLPTGVAENISWRTLLFRPQASRPFDPAGPKDHLLLDLFWMPVVEPYAISEPFSTGGKVNMNYQIVPFTYINRSTSVQAVLSSELIPRIPTSGARSLSTSDEQNNFYKGKPGSPTPSNPPGGVTLLRLPLNMSETDGTLRQFREKFDAGRIFKSASEICDIYLVPQGYSWNSDTAANASWYGNDFALVGDNVRERPYANLYPRLTTKSNTFTVHYKVQTLKGGMGAGASQWNEARGTVTGEYRGSTTLERYLNPNNSEIEDYATDFAAPSLDKYYQWRIVSNTAFSP